MENIPKDSRENWCTGTGVMGKVRTGTKLGLDDNVFVGQHTVEKKKQTLGLENAEDNGNLAWKLEI